MNLSQEMLMTIVGWLVNAGVTYGVVRTNLAWLRADINSLQLRLYKIESWAMRHGHRREWENDETAPGKLR